MINPFEQINWKPEKKDIRSFGRTVIIGLACLAVFFYLTGALSQIGAVILAGAGALICLLSFTLTFLAKPFYLIWFFIAACIGIVISNVLLTLFYYLMFTPFVLLVRTVTGRDPLQLKNPGETVWIVCDKKKDLKRYLKQY